MYEHGETLTKFVLNLKKRTVSKIESGNSLLKREITDYKEIFNNIKTFCDTLFKLTSLKTNVEKQEFRNSSTLTH